MLIIFSIIWHSYGNNYNRTLFFNKQQIFRIMKKVLFLALGSALTFGFNTVAQAAPTNNMIIAAEDAAKDQKEKIEVAALPEAVKKALASDTYKDIKVESAFLIKGEKATYEIVGKKGDTDVTLRFDEAGNVLS
jgi:hypothetical protein